jgi:hypothetical protein
MIGGMTDVSAMRAAAARAAKLLKDKSRLDEAVVILSAAAAAGPNDPEGQDLLADALRIAPSAPIAQAAFSRMEGVPGDQPELDAAIARYDLPALEALEKSLRPVFRRAQVGFNNNVKYQGAVYHVQTEDSGLDKPHIITHLFADGGRIIKTHKREYASEVDREDVATFVRTLMKGQHMEMLLKLREGNFDEVIAGRAVGGMETLEHPPKVDLDKVGSRKKASAAQPRGAVFKVQGAAAQGTSAVAPQAPSVASPVTAQAATATPLPGGIAGAGASAALGPGLSGSPGAGPAPPVPGAPAATQGVRPKGPAALAALGAVPGPKPEPKPAGKVHLTLHVVRSLYGGPERYDPVGDEIVLGREGQVALEGERFCHPCEAIIYLNEGKLLLEDVDGGNGVFLRIRRRVELADGDEFIVGDHLLRLELNPLVDDGPDPGPTYFRSSMKSPSSFRVVQTFEGGATGWVAMARETTLQIGSINDDYYANDLILYGDPLVDPYHCVIEQQADAYILSDFGARSGVFVRVMGTHELAHGDELLVGRTRLMVDLSPSDPSLRPLG